MKHKKWQSMKTAPRNSTTFIGKMKDGTELEVYFAKDLNGEEEPYFSGFFFKLNENTFSECHPIAWKPKALGERVVGGGKGTK